MREYIGEEGYVDLEENYQNFATGMSDLRKLPLSMDY